MFWGLSMSFGKKYTQIVQEPFHVSQACLDLNSLPNESDPVQVIIRYEEQDYLLTTLSKTAKIYQTPLDLNFQRGTKVCFRTYGPGQVHLSGYHVPDDDDLEGRLMNESDSDLEDEPEEMETPSSPPRKRKKGQSDSVAATNKKKKINDTVALSSDEDEDEDDEDDDDDDGDDSDIDSNIESSFLSSLAEDDEEEEDEQDSDEDDEEECTNTINGDVTPSKKGKLAKLEKQKTPTSVQGKQKNVAKTPKTPEEGGKTPKKTKTPKQGAESPKHEAKTPKQEGKTPKKNEAKTPKQDAKTPNTTASSPTPKKTVLEGGVIAEELKVGDGPLAKLGKTAQVYYTGRLKSNLETFDSVSKGPGFRFKLGRGEVIKGWEIGVSGMKVGGKRRVTIPAGLAYGAKGSAPCIPPNATLIFDIELRGIS